MKNRSTRFECYNCEKLLDIKEGVWIDNGGSWSMVIICNKCYNKIKINEVKK